MYTPHDIEDNQKNLILSVIGLSSITTNDTIYFYGGETSKNTFNNNLWFIYTKDISLNTSPTLLKSRQNEKISLNLASGVVVDNSIIAICSNSTTSSSIQPSINATISSNITSPIPQYMSVCSFNLSTVTKNNSWTTIPSLSSSLPSTRDNGAVSISADQNQLYIFGGQKYMSPQQLNETTTLRSKEDIGSFWKYDIGSSLWSKLSSPYTNNLSRCGHTATMLSDGRIVIIGGYNCLSITTTEIPSSSSVDLLQMNTILLFDSTTTSWINAPQSQGTVPLARTYHSAALMNSNNDIFICGGQNELLSPFQVYMGSQNNHLDDMAAILDTNSWTWRKPKQSPINQPYPQSFATLNKVNGTKLVYGYGINYHTVYDQFRVFDTITETWEPTILSKEILNMENTSNNFNTSLLWTILGCIGFIILSSYGFAVWKVGFKRFHTKIINGLTIIKREVWKPRVGEPGWTETLRLVLKLLFLFLFVYLISTLTSQVINSPIIDQLSFENNPGQTIDVPDIKFCFENNEEDRDKEPFIQCATDFGVQCSQYITPVPEQSHANAEKTRCLLFNAPLSFKLGQTSERLHSNGSNLNFEYYYKINGTTPLVNDVSAGSRQVQVTLYNKLDVLETMKKSNNDINIHNSNENPSIYGWNDISEENEYKYTNSRGDMNKNSHHINFGFISTINFELIKRVTLNSGVWNYAGVASSVSTSHEIETAETPKYFATMFDPSSGSPQPLGSLRVIPLTMQTKVLREQKAFAFINAMGIFGGLFGLLFSLQSCLFGYRPRSPWGYMHRWSFGHFRSSLLRGLQVNFFPNNAALGSELNTKTQPFQKQEQLYKYRMSPNDSKVNTLASRIDQIMETNNVHPLTVKPQLTIQTKNLQNNTTSYLLPTSPTLSIPMGHHEDENEIRMALIEDRIHMLERLFQAYYIDDEIFRSLDHALKKDSLSSSSSSTTSVDSAKTGRKLK